jgi:hypothetical protein
MRQHYKPYCPIINDKPLYTLLQYPILLVVKSLFLLCEIQKLLLLQLRPRSIRRLTTDQLPNADRNMTVLG